MAVNFKFFIHGDSEPQLASRVKSAVQYKTEQRWRDTIDVDTRWLDLEEDDVLDRARWNRLVERGVRQKPATRSGYG